MKTFQNLGKVDRAVRLAIGAVALILGLFSFTGVTQIALLLVSLIGLGTGIMGFCGLYSLFGISTCPIKKKK